MKTNKSLIHFSLAIIVISFFINHSYAQENIGRQKFYNTWISFTIDSLKLKGILYELQDSSIVISNSLVVKNYPDGDYELTRIYIREIDKIKTRRTKNTGRGILIGAVSGIAIGGIIGLVDGDDPPGWFAMTAGEKATFLGVFLGGCGAITGGAIGTIRINFTINGNVQSYRSQKRKMQKYSLKYN